MHIKGEKKQKQYNIRTKCKNQLKEIENVHKKETKNTNGVKNE